MNEELIKSALAKRDAMMRGEFAMMTAEEIASYRRNFCTANPPPSWVVNQFPDGATGGEFAPPPPQTSATLPDIGVPWQSLADFPKVVAEKDNPDILIKGRWLERGCGAFLISTAGTGKSIFVTQCALCWNRGLGFAGLVPWHPLKVWVVQSEDSPSRVAIDREDIRDGLREAYPMVDWDAAVRETVFVGMTGTTGAKFIDALDEYLALAKSHGCAPDVVIINPLLAFLGGDVSSARDIGAFFRGGQMGNEQTQGLQSVLEKHRVAAFIAHHTGKPPTDKELDSWLVSDMPEYKACGSSDITNWGRSFLTMMKVRGFAHNVMLTAGKNGGGLGWEELGGQPRRILAHGEGQSCSGSGRRHFWRDADEDAVAKISAALFKTADGEPTAQTDAVRLAEVLRDEPMTRSEVVAAQDKFPNVGFSFTNNRRFSAAWNLVREKFRELGLASATVPVKGGRNIVFYGRDPKLTEIAEEQARIRGSSAFYSRATSAQAPRNDEMVSDCLVTDPII